MTFPINLFSRSSLTIAICTIGLSTASLDAEAGSFGLYGHSGIHEGKAYYYRSDGKQGVDSQFRPHAGTGFEMMLGDKDDRLIGQIRLGWTHDWFHCLAEKGLWIMPELWLYMDER